MTGGTYRFGRHRRKPQPIRRTSHRIGITLFLSAIALLAAATTSARNTRVAFVVAAVFIIAALGNEAPRLLARRNLTAVQYVQLWRRWRRLRDRVSNRCRHCRYDLRGCRGGVCPECGKKIPASKDPRTRAD
jgi:hypothetical protein